MSAAAGDMAAAKRFRFGTKAETLARLAPLLKRARLCDQIVVPVAEWRRNNEPIVQQILERFGGERLAVRSSSIMEDGWLESNAGRFESVLGVVADEIGLCVAIEKVIDSYGGIASDQQVLIQPMVDNVALSGVVLTRDLDTGSPYYVIAYDDFTGRTDTVTGGTVSKVALVHRSNPDALHSPRMRAVIEAVQEVETATGSERLDIEFCMNAALEVTILQVRPLAAQHRWHHVPDAAIDGAIARVRAEVAAMQRPVAGLAGAVTILGEMPDWNPAEMIGTTPRRLAVSLYRRLITDRVWAEARARMGYVDVPHPLMVEAAGRPYIDVRLSFNSFLPAVLDPALRARLVDAQLARLAVHPEHHDKIEFEIAITCRDLAYQATADTYLEAGLTREELATWGEALGALTARCLKGGRAAIEALLVEARTLLDDASSTGAPLVDADARLNAVARHGTLPFSMLARHAFIGVAFLRSLVRRDLLSPGEADRFMRGVRTIATEVVEAISAVAQGNLATDAFLARFGHLRPGTYDILSWRYDERPELYLGHASRAAPHVELFHPGPDRRAAIDRALADAGYDCDAGRLFDYIAAAIAAREEAKFAFSRGISDALSLIGAWGETVGLSRETLSYIGIADLLAAADDAGRLRALAAEGAEAHALARALRFPHLIVEPDDLDVVRPLRGQATFITNASVTARAVHLTRNEIVPLHGKIVTIESADPGYDWIFSHDIRGLITEHGGANSHMAIRCAEFGLPAAIGCGERLFRSLADATVIELNCAARTVRGH